MSEINVFFFRGLSTEGTDDIKWSPFDQGPMHRELSRAFTKRQVNLIPIAGMGSGSWPELAQRAHSFLQSHPVWQNDQIPVHLFGHSAGGVVMRLLLEDGLRRSNLLSALTMASPHQGARLAEIFANLPRSARHATVLFHLLGFDVRNRSSVFETVTPAVVQGLWREITLPNDLRYGTIVCNSPAKNWCHLLKLAHKMKFMGKFDEPSDGVVEISSQAWGEPIAEIDIDHVRQLGFFNDGQSFDHQCDVLCDFFKETQARATKTSSGR